MSHEQAFEHLPEETGSVPIRAWSAESLREQDLATMLEQRELTATVNHRLSALRHAPLVRHVGNTLTVGAVVFLSLVSMAIWANHERPPYLIPVALFSLISLNRALRSLDSAKAALALQEYDLRWIGPLIEALAWPNRRIKEITKHMSLFQKSAVAVVGLSAKNATERVDRRFY